MGRTIYPHDGYADKRLRSISQDDDPKEWLLEIITPDLLTLCGKRLDDWGVASLETGLRGEVSGGQN